MIELLHDTHVWYAISFVIFILAAIKFGKKPVFEKLDRRIEEIRNEIKAAEMLRIEAQELMAQYQRKQREAAKEAKVIIESARQHAEQIRRQAAADLDEAIGRREQQMQDRLRRMEEVAILEIRAFAAELAVKATAEIIAKKMDEQANSRLIDSSIRQISAQLA